MFEASDFATQRTAQDGNRDGFQWSLGHGVGLDVHEGPPLGFAGHDPLLGGDVISLEPGLWDSRFGGITFEFPYDLTPSG